MKRLIAITVCIAITVITFSSCRPSSYQLSDSEIDKMYSTDYEDKVLVHPSGEEIFGIYDVIGTSESSEATEWKVHVNFYGGKTVMQIFKLGSDFIPATEEAVNNVESVYNPVNGVFKQKYTNEQYVSTYTASFNVEDDGRIKIIVFSKYLYFEYNEEQSGVNASGYKIIEEPAQNTEQEEEEED